MRILKESIRVRKLGPKWECGYGVIAAMQVPLRWLGLLALAGPSCSPMRPATGAPLGPLGLQAETATTWSSAAQQNRSREAELGNSPHPARDIPEERPTLSRHLRFDPALPEHGFLPRASPEETGLLSSALDDLIGGAEASRSEAVLVVSQGKVIAERYSTPGSYDERIQVHSLSKAVVSMAIGLLLKEGLLPSLDTPVSHWFPEWRNGPRAAIRLRHLLNHTSGLQSEVSDITVYRQRDTVAYARTLASVDPPGTRYAYDNASTQLLAGIMEQATGVPVDQFIQDRILSPIGVTGVHWEKDLANHCLVYAGLSIRPRDLARLGLLMARRGVWKGHPVIPTQWFTEATRPNPVTPGYGLLLELYFNEYTHKSTEETLEQLQRAGLAFAAKLTPLVNRPFHFREEYWMEAGALLSAEERSTLVQAIEQGRAPVPFQSVPGRQSGFGHSGTFGQYLMVYPERDLVFVRLVKRFDASRPRVDFEESVMTVLRRSSSAYSAGDRPRGERSTIK